MKKSIISSFIFCLTFLMNSAGTCQDKLTINDSEYFSSSGISVFLFSDFYFEGHQGGINIIQNGTRVASNGDLRLESSPGQWEAYSQLDNKDIDKEDNTITLSLSYPNEQAKNRQFNPVKYPDLELKYKIIVKGEGNGFRITVSLDKPIPKEWLGKAGFVLELYPGDLFGKSYFMDDQAGIFPIQLNGPVFGSGKNDLRVEPLASGKKLILAPESEKQRMTIESISGPLELIDGRSLHNNGWFIVRSLIIKGVTSNAVEWIVTPSVGSGTKYGPVIHINQVGYLPKQNKKALIECDKTDSLEESVKVQRILPSGAVETAFTGEAQYWGIYQHFSYYLFDFSSITQPGVYNLTLNKAISENFIIDDHVYDRHVWQPTLEYFLPVQMCHMRVNDRYKVWHGLCHMDDARMAPTDHVHFDGYSQGNSTLTRFNPMEHVPGLNAGGWHDAGDYDLRIESQGGTVYMLSLIYEAFHPDYDVTTIDQANHIVEMHVPDGIPDILQQIEHGTISIINGYRSLGRLYRGIICKDLQQYVLLGDGSVMTDNVVYTQEKKEGLPPWLGRDNDDRWVFTEINPKRELQVCSHLAAASRVLKSFNDTLARQSLDIAEALWAANSDENFTREKIVALVELILATEKQEYIDQLIGMKEKVAGNVSESGWAVSRILNRIDDAIFLRGYMLSVQKYFMDLKTETSENPFGVSYKPKIWGSAWGIEQFGVEQYYYYKLLNIEDARKYMINALNYVLGLHPGENTLSFVSGVGTKSTTIAYGLNRDDWSYIPGGVVSGTAYIKPDFPEFKDWPYLWQQSEYVIGGAASSFMFLVLGTMESVH